MHALTDHVRNELTQAERAATPQLSFHHLERAHILSQYSTRDHMRVHLAMLKWARNQRDWREAFGQIIRLAGAATKTAIGMVPVGNTGGSNVSAIKPMKLPDDLAAIIARYR
ncbi:DUF3703 domain-containing protein [Erythrobacter crassostreae]|uniref:DUF3703 domain-containing protein n=1 Tax=Erythrobacter crassostreae TaxID=2828328 RepID=A0A9X1JNH4_9SPHN|nr:DUF3703 domain-containing protein [Erythrobacter crassostrea]MBV7258427.1 DUF3703 domain-containing protein [Erythrobacter crassostrea]